MSDSNASQHKPYLVAVLYYGGIDPEHKRCVEALEGKPQIANVLEMTGCSYIDIGRSIIATSVLDNPELGGLLFIDHDMIFAVDEALRVIAAAEEHQATVGAAYSMRRPGRIIGAVDGSKIAQGEKVVFFEGGRVLPANYLGMGMTAIARRSLEALVALSAANHDRMLGLIEQLKELITERDKEPALEVLEQLMPFFRGEDLPRLQSGISDAPVVPFFSLLQRDGTYFGEDVSFCIRNHLAGLPVMIDTRARVYHKGSYCYGLEDVGMEVPYCTTLQVIDTADPKVADAPSNELVKNSLGQADGAERRPVQSVRFVTVTRGSEGDFWTQSLLGRSLKAMPIELRPRLTIRSENDGPSPVGLSRLYNYELDQAEPGELVVFVHDDVFVHDPFVVARLIEASQSADVIGLAGSLGSNFAHPSWALGFGPALEPLGWQTGVTFSGAVSHVRPGHEQAPPPVELSYYGAAPAACDLLDGLFLAVRPERLAAKSVRFDERFDFHLYDIDFCRSASLAGLRLMTWPLIVSHASAGNYASAAWKAAARLYRQKWASAPEARVAAAE